MGLYELKSKDEWQEILDHVAEETGMVAAITDVENSPVQTSGERNPLCAKIRSIAESASYICNKSQMAMAGEARFNREPVVEMCEAGLSKFVVPLYDGEEWVGSLTACGSCFSKEDIDDFVIGKNTNLEEGEIQRLIQCVSVGDENKIISLAGRLHEQLSK